MFKNIKTVKGVVVEASQYVADVKYHLEENKNVYVAAGLGFLVGAGVILAVRSRPVVVNNVINICRSDS